MIYRYLVILLVASSIGCSTTGGQSSHYEDPSRFDPPVIQADEVHEEVHEEVREEVPEEVVSEDVIKDDFEIDLVSEDNSSTDIIEVDCSVTESCIDDKKLPEDSVDIQELDIAEKVVDTAADKEEALLENKEKDQNFLDTALDFCNASQEFWSEGNLEQAIKTLDEAYSLVLKVNTDRSPELIQQKEDLRFMISKRILEIYASRYTAVNGNHNEIPLTMNKHVEMEIKRFQGPERKFFLESYKRSGKFMDMITAELKEAGLPQDLAWLPLIESGFKIRALSRARALGLWQFIPSTGYKFGLKRDTWIDQRLNPEKATSAAIAYMKELHQIFGDWMTVLAAYNCGEGRVLRQIRNQKVNYLDNFWDLYQQLPRETARYVPRFLATLHILKDPEKYGFEMGEPDRPTYFETVSIEKQVQLKVVAKKIGMPFKELTSLNAELRHQVTPPTEYLLKLPQDRVNVFQAHLNEIPKWTPPENAYVYHRVKKGETLSLIAKRYRKSISKIVRANNIRKKHFIRVGQKLKVPLRGSSSRKTYASAEALMPGSKYKIKKGDSLWLIARKFKTNTKKLQRINNLRTTRLRVGQVLKVSE
jgi:membrane-bound lytic murein transglycosylase D